MAQPPQAVLFDALGTLVELEPPWPRLIDLLRSRFGIEVEWDDLTSHLGDLGIGTPEGVTLRQLRERYVVSGHLDEANATAMRRVTATLEKSRYDRPERTTPQEASQLHDDIRSIRRQVGRTRAWQARARSFFWPEAGVSFWRSLPGHRLPRLPRLPRRRGWHGPAPAPCRLRRPPPG